MPGAWSLLCAAALSVAALGPAWSMDFALTVGRDPTKNRGSIVATGPIQPGDDAKLHAFVGKLSPDIQLVGFLLDSPGGNYVEGVRLANTVKNSHLKTAVMPNSVCASACFLVFVAGYERIMFQNSQLGVHSASTQDGSDNTTAQAVTTLMARRAAEYGVPPAIIGKMVTTPPSQMAWLTSEDRRSLNVDVRDTRVPEQSSTYVPGSALIPGRSQPQAPAVLSQPAGATAAMSPAMPNPVLPPETTYVQRLAYTEGYDQRTKYEAWFAKLSGDTKTGAMWWATNRSRATRDRLTCNNDSADFFIGCLVAQNVLADADSRRLKDPFFRMGWNSY